MNYFWVRVFRADRLINPFKRIWFRHWFGLFLRPEGSGEGGKKVNGDIYGDTILKEKWGKLKINTVN